MTRTLFVEAGAAGARACLMERGRVVAHACVDGFSTGPREPAIGDIFSAIVRKRVASLSGAFVDLGDAEAFLPDRKAFAPPEGARLVVAVRRVALDGKAAVVTPDWRKWGLASRDADFDPGRKAGLLNPSPDRVASLFAGPWLRQPDELVVNSPYTASSLGCVLKAAHLPPARIDADAVADCAIGERLMHGLLPSVDLPGGARMVIDETAGGAVIDIDAGAAADGRNPAHVARSVNREACERLESVCRERRLAGRILIDFLPPNGAANRKALSDFVARLARTLGGRAGEVRADGLADLTAPRSRRSLLDDLTEPEGAGLRPGRRLRASLALTFGGLDLETRLAQFPRGRFDWRLAPALSAVNEDAMRALIADLAGRYGPRASIFPDPKLEPRGYAIDETSPQ